MSASSTISSSEWTATSGTMACCTEDLVAGLDPPTVTATFLSRVHGSCCLEGFRMPLDDTPSVTRRSVRAQVAETLATLREVVLMPRDLGPLVPHQVDHEDDLVVLVHGFFASAGVWRPMKRELVAATGAQ